MPSLPRVLVTRSHHQASALADRLRERGCEPVLIPTIETTDPTSFQALDQAFAGIETFHWILFTSANAVEAFAHRLSHHRLRLDDIWHGRSSSDPVHPGTKTSGARASFEARLEGGEPGSEKKSSGSRGVAQSLNGERFIPFAISGKEYGTVPLGRTGPLIAAIGPATERALEQLGLVPHLVPPQAIAESLTDSLLPHARQPGGGPTRFLLIRAEEARELLPETLRAAGAAVMIAPAYRTTIPAGAAEQLRHLLANEPPDAITFTSSSTARNLFALLEASDLTLPESVIRASIGPITSATLRELHHPPHVEAPAATVSDLAEVIVNYLTGRPRREWPR